ncbi:ThuA domain-containing protein [Flavihumibacter sp. UBA7668]|uniref:ThuA domain-containing protein n=1 Tax=Flavihumibacter sp. UBA7668 TaxID=1946542 RepID=UPI0025C6EE24|nr:ThuA domain-containing protein [Flavihumibacter sp. UBA7668]
MIKIIQLHCNKFIGLAVVSFCLLSCTEKAGQKKSVLVFSKTTGGYRHASIEAGKKMFMQTGVERGYQVDTTENSGIFTAEGLKKYQGIVFLNTRGDILDSLQQLAFQQFIRSGGGFTGIHAATTTEYDWPWYNKLIGAYFDGHPEPQQAVYQVKDKTFPAVKHLPASFSWYDEVYNFRSVSDSLNVILTVQEDSYSGGKMGSVHPVSWYHEFEGGRSFYVGLGHFDEAYTDSSFIRLVWVGIEWTL